jgi:hypothetical protein
VCQRSLNVNEPAHLAALCAREAAFSQANEFGAQRPSELGTKRR